MCMGEVGSNLSRHYVIEHHTSSGGDNNNTDEEDESDEEMTTPTEVGQFLKSSACVVLLDSRTEF